MFFFNHSGVSLAVLGAVCLSVTGAEALYADLGHFGGGPIRTAWLYLVFPALVINYFGQGALVLAHPEAAESPLFRLVPDWALLPMVILATLATIIASQAVITGRILADAAGRPARPPAAPRDPLHLGAASGPDLRAAREHAAAHRRDRAGADLPVVEQPVPRLRRLGLRRHVGRRGPGHHRDLEGLALVARPDPGADAALPVHRPVVLRRQPAEALHRRLRAGHPRVGDHRDDVDLGEGHRESCSRRPARSTCPSSNWCGCWKRARRIRSRARPCSSPAIPTPRPRPCCTISSTTRCCTRRTSS